MPISIGNDVYFQGSLLKGFFLIDKIIYDSTEYELQIEEEKQQLYHQEKMKMITAMENLDGLTLIPS